MTDNPQSEPIVPEHTVQITHYHRPAGAAGAWSQFTTAAITFREAIDWLSAKMAEVAGHQLHAAEPVVEPQTPADEGVDPSTFAAAPGDAPVAADTAGEVTT